jgi:hypothetical protein
MSCSVSAMERTPPKRIVPVARIASTRRSI